MWRYKTHHVVLTLFTPCLFSLGWMEIWFLMHCYMWDVFCIIFFDSIDRKGLKSYSCSMFIWSEVASCEMRTLGSPVECSSKRSELVRSSMTLVHDLFGQHVATSADFTLHVLKFRWSDYHSLTIHDVWYIYLHLLYLYGKCRKKYQSHGCFWDYNSPQRIYVKRTSFFKFLRSCFDLLILPLLLDEEVDLGMDKSLPKEVICIQTEWQSTIVQYTSIWMVQVGILHMCSCNLPTQFFEVLELAKEFGGPQNFYFIVGQQKP